MSEFKILYEEAQAAQQNERTRCPFCGYSGNQPEFNTPAQDEHLQAVALAHFEQAIDRGLRASANAFNGRQPKGGFLELRMAYRSFAPPRPLPPEATSVMRMELLCETCACRYRVIGSSYFCPNCGHSSAERTFGQTLDRLRESLGVYARVAPTLTPDESASLRIMIVEGGLCDLVTAFQFLAEALFNGLPQAAAAAPRANVFQNLSDASATWQSGGGRSFACFLNQAELAELEKVFQQRHLLEHREGFVDQKYINKSKDDSYVSGERIVVREDAVEHGAQLLEKLVSGMRSDVAATP